MRTRGIGAIARSLGYAAVAATIVATAVHFRHHDPKPRDPSGIIGASSTDPLTRQLAHCKALGTAAANDSACVSAWIENRRRFFTYAPMPSASAKAGQPQ